MISCTFTGMADSGTEDLQDWLPLLLQTVDPLFPTGAYAHSLGLEELTALGHVGSASTLESFLQETVAPALAFQECPYLRFAHCAAAEGDLALLSEIDDEIDAWKLAAEVREASRAMGRRRLRILCQTYPDSLAHALSAEIEGGCASGHHITICAIQNCTLGIPLRPGLLAYVYQAFAAYATASLKLLRIGQEACQKALAGALTRAAAIVDCSLRVERAEAGFLNPLQDIASARHATAFSRLFIS